MRANMRAVAIGGMLMGVLGGCTLGDFNLAGAKKPAVEAPPAQQAKADLPAPISEELRQAYAARQDGAFTVPAVPIEKVPERLRRQEVDFASNDPVGTIIINPTAKTLHFVTGEGKAIRYGIAVGKDGFQWAGESLVTGRKHWPRWTPPPEMVERKPSLKKWEDGQPGGPTNPLGARALYLTTGGVDYGFRIHGTPEWYSIGKNASSGCFRMIQQDVMDLYDRVPNGAKVIVLNADGSRPSRLKLPPAPKRTAKPKPVEAKPAVTAPTATPAVVPPATQTPAIEPVPGTAAPLVLTPAQPTPAEPAPIVPNNAPVNNGSIVPVPQPVVPAVPVPSVPPAVTAPVVTPAVPAPVVPAPAAPTAPVIAPAPVIVPTPVTPVPAVPAPVTP